MRQGVEVRLRPVRGDPARVPVGPPGKPDVHPRAPPRAARAPEDRQDGSYSRQRPTGGDRLDPARVRVWRGPGDVIVQQHDERLACGHARGGSRGGSARTQPSCRRDQRRCQRRTPPARAGGVRDIVDALAHPVNWDGPWRGCSTRRCAGAVGERHGLRVGGVLERDASADPVGAGRGAQRRSRTETWSDCPIGLPSRRKTTRLIM